jgi:ureidoacrylate peracid hydrolase
MKQTTIVTLKDKVKPTHTVVLVVDIQNDFCSTKGALAKLGADITAIRQMLPRLIQFINQAREARVPIIYIQHINSDETTSPPLMEKRSQLGRDRVPVCQKGTWGAELLKELHVAPLDIVVQKYRYSAFINTSLDLILRSRGIKSLIITGMSTNVCVESTARDGFMHDYFIVLPEDCLATTISVLHQPSLETLKRYFATVTTSHAIVEAWHNCAD